MEARPVTCRRKSARVASASAAGRTPAPVYDYIKDPNENYIEELADRYHNPPLPTEGIEGGVSPADLRRIPPPPPFPVTILPDTGHCKWSWDEDSRVLFADFSELEASRLNHIDEKFFLEMMERDDVTVISAGLVSPRRIDHDIWNIEYIGQVLDKEYFHKIRRFDTVVENGLTQVLERDTLLSMRPCDYVKYIGQRKLVLGEQLTSEEEKGMKFFDHKGIEQSINNVGTTALYLIDLDVPKLLPKVYLNFMESMRMPGVLPGGAHCMMSAVNTKAQPFMGPNLYITPPTSFTYFHQDGHGTVDSGHLCIAGYNEIIIVRRLTERHKQHALWLLTGDRKQPDKYFNGLYEEPHGDDLGKKPAWPTTDKIKACAEMGYCPSVCILKPGQMIHINKGRLHAFRKLSNHNLPEDDCHATLREKLVRKEELKKEEVCISIAWDWIYLGVTAAGINREVCSTLACAGLNGVNRKKSLGIPELSLLHMARSIVDNKTHHEDRKIFGLERKVYYNKTLSCKPSEEVVCNGIYCSLQAIVQKHVVTMKQSQAIAKTKGVDGVSVMKNPDAYENQLVFTIDPYGGDYYCVICYKELSNVYFHCNGCEQLLSKDFNICETCHSEKNYKINHLMHAGNNSPDSAVNHTGDMKLRCSCEKSIARKVCGSCKKCVVCCCNCHSQFSIRIRFFNQESEQMLLRRLKLLIQPGRQVTVAPVLPIVVTDEMTVDAMDVQEADMDRSLNGYMDGGLTTAETTTTAALEAGIFHVPPPAPVIVGGISTSAIATPPLPQPLSKKTRGERGKDVKPRKKRICYLCSRGILPSSTSDLGSLGILPNCPGGYNRRNCLYFHETGETKWPS